MQFRNSSERYGLVIFGLVAIRLFWRLGGTTPARPDGLPRWQARAADAVHLSLYAALLIMPLLGWIIVSASPLGIPTLIFGKVEIPHLAFILDSPDKQLIGSIASWAHWVLAWAASLAVICHIAAALVHHLVMKGATMAVCARRQSDHMAGDARRADIQWRLFHIQRGHCFRSRRS